MKKKKTTPRRRQKKDKKSPIELVLRPYQMAIFECRQSGVIILHWARQIGKSFTLAAWAVDRAITEPGHLITVLSNSRENGMEFLEKCNEVCRLLEKTLRARRAEVKYEDLSADLSLANMRLEVKFTIQVTKHIVKVSRIKVLAANPRTARGFSGDLILDEFAFHENSAAIWEAAEPILAANPNFLCCIASTGNGKHNLFYRMGVPGMAAVGSPAHPLTPALSPSGGEGDGKSPGLSLAPTGGEGGRRPGEGATPTNDALKNNPTPPPYPPFLRSQSGFTLSRITRTQAHGLGVKIYDPMTRMEIAPEQARAQALDKRAYDQNYECAFADENLTLLSHNLISMAECEGVGEISEQDWTANQLALLEKSVGRLFVGFDVARRVDLSVITVMEKLGELYLVRAMLRIRDLRLPEQQARLGQICRLPKFQRAVIDMTGLGLGLYEYAQNEFGASRIHGINFAASVPATRAIRREGRPQVNVRVTEALALELLQCYEDRRIKHPADARLRDDLRKPEKVTTPGGRVSIAATRDEAGHADHFWSLALAIEAAATAPAPFACETFKQTRSRTSFI